MQSPPARTALRTRSPHRRFLAALVALFTVSLLARLPLCWDAATVRNDGAEYLAIARSLRTTGGYASDLKYQFYTDDPVWHPAWGDRPPLYPVIAAVCELALPALNPTAAARLGNALLAAVAAILAALYLRRVFEQWSGIAAAGFVSLLPNTIYWTAQPMTEALSLALSFGALLAWIGAQASRRSGIQGFRSSGLQAFTAGVLSGLTYLARPTGALLAFIFGLDALRRRKDGGMRDLVPLAGGFLLCALPYHLLLWRLYGSPLHSSLAYTFCVANYYEVTYYGFERPHLSALEFLRTRGAKIPQLILEQAWNHIQAICLPLAALLPFAFRWRRRDWSGLRWVIAALVVLTVAVHTVVWSAWGSQRYFLLVLYLVAGALLSAGVGGPASGDAASSGRGAPDAGAGDGTPNTRDPSSIPWRLLSIILPAATSVGLAIALVGFYREQLRPDHGIPMLPTWKAAAEAVRGSRLIASSRPATMNLLLEAPAVMLPYTTDPAELGRFTAKYRPDVMMLFVEEPEKETAEGMARHWRAGGLPAGWHLDQDLGTALIARPDQPSTAP